MNYSSQIMDLQEYKLLDSRLRRNDNKGLGNDNKGLGNKNEMRVGLLGYSGPFCLDKKIDYFEI
jgi:hypothetical protein